MAAEPTHAAQWALRPFPLRTAPKRFARAWPPPSRPIARRSEEGMDWTVIGRVASRQYGISTRAQLLDAGLTRAQIELAIGEARLVVVQQGVYRLAGAPVSVHGTLLAGVLAAGVGA